MPLVCIEPLGNSLLKMPPSLGRCKSPCGVKPPVSNSVNCWQGGIKCGSFEFSAKQSQLMLDLPIVERYCFRPHTSADLLSLLNALFSAIRTLSWLTSKLAAI